MDKKNFISLFSSLLCFSLAVDGFALPKDHQVVSGTSEFKQIDSHQMEVRPSDQAIINYSKFDIGKGEKVNFIQKSSSSCVLNRVHGNNSSEVFGSLESNGKVFLVNPNGIYFGPEAQVNVGSLIASTLDISNTDFLQENYKFSLNGKNAVIKNEGLLNSVEGSIALLAPQIQNLGSITARAGSVVLTSGEHVTLDFTGDGLIQFSVEGTLKDALIEQLGDITASVVQLKIPAAKKAISEIVNLDGMEEGDVFIEENGVIKFASAASIEAKKVLMEAANLKVEGSIDASSLLDKGGEIHLFGRDISLEGAKIDASGSVGGGKVLIGGEYQGKGSTPYASKVTMNESSQILVNAIDSGDGGLVVLWSLDRTIFNGKIFSQGGAEGGDGGLVETSSHYHLGIQLGFVDTSAPLGKYGDWLLDPLIAYIVDSTLPEGSGCPDGVGCSHTTTSCDCNCDCITSGKSCCFGVCCETKKHFCTDFGCCEDYPRECCNISSSSIESSTSNVLIQANSAIYLYANINMQNSDVTFGFDYCNTEYTSYIYGPFVSGNLGTSCTITTRGGSVTIPNGVLNGDLTINSSGGSVNLSNCSMPSLPSSGFYELNINAGSGDVTLSTISSYLGSITINSTGSIAPNLISMIGDFVQTGEGSVSLGNNVTANSISFAGPISLSETITLGSSQALTLLSSVNGTTPGSQGLTLTATESINVGNLGDSVALGPVSLTTSEGSMIKSIITQTGLISLSAPSFALGSDSVIDSTNGGATGATITASGDINATTAGGQSLTVNAGDKDININQLGSSISLGALSLTGNAINISNSTTLWKATSVEVQGSIISTAASLEIINSGVFTLESESDVSLVGAFIQTGSGLVTLGSNVAANSISFAGPITLSETIVLDSLQDLTLSSSVEGTTPGSQGLTLTAVLAINVNDLGDTTALGPVTLTSYTSQAGSMIQNVTTQGGAITLFSGTSFTLGKSCIINSTNGGDYSAAISIDGDINATTAGIETLRVDATGISSAAGIILKGSVGKSKELGSFTISGDSSIANSKVTFEDPDITPGVSIVAKGGITIEPPLVLAGSTTMTGADVQILGQTVPTTAGSQSLEVYASGAITVAQIGNNSSPLGGVVLNAFSASSIQSIVTGGDIVTGSGEIVLSAPSFTISSSDNAIVIDSTAGGSFNGAPITILGAIDATSSGVETLSLQATGLNDTASVIILSGPVGDSVPLRSFEALGNSALYSSRLQLGDSSLSDTAINAVDFIDMSELYGVDVASSSSLLVTGGPINLGNAEVNGVIPGGQSFSADSGSFGIDLGPAGFTFPLGTVTLTGATLDTSGIRTEGGAITIITASTNLEVNAVIFDTTNNNSVPSGADIIFPSTVNSKSGTSDSLLVTAGSGGIVTFSDDIGGISPLTSLTISSASNVNIKNVTVNNDIEIIPHSTLSGTGSLTSFISNSDGDILLGDIDGTTNSAQSVTVVTGSGAVALGVIGASAVLDEVSVPTGSSATIHSITVSGSLEIDIPIILAASSTLSTIGEGVAGSTITFKSINGSNVGGESLTVTTGTGNVVFTDQVGYLVPPGNLDITGSTIQFEGNLVVAAGTHSYHSPSTIFQNIVFRSLGDMTFDSTVEPVSGTPDFVLYPGSGTLTFSDSVGDAPFGNVLVYNAGSFSAQDIIAKSLRVVGGLPSIFLHGDITALGIAGVGFDGGPINFGGEIAASHIWARSHGPMSVLNTAQAINISGDTPRTFEYFNAIGGNIGSPSSPIELNTTHQSNLGAGYRADFVGDPFHRIFFSIPSNPPCIVTFNNVITLDCNTVATVQENFNSIPKNLFYITWLYSSWDNLSNPEFFVQEAINPAQNPRDSKLTYWVMTRRYQETDTVPPPDAFKNVDIISKRIEGPISYEEVLANLDKPLEIGEIKEIVASESLVTKAHIPDPEQIVAATREVGIEELKEKAIENAEAAILYSARNMEPIDLSIDDKIFSGLNSIQDAAEFKRIEVVAGFEIEDPTVVEVVVEEKEETPDLVVRDWPLASKVILEVIKVPLSQIEPKQEEANWGFFVDLPEASFPLDIYIE